MVQANEPHGADCKEINERAAVNMVLTGGKAQVV